MHPSPVGYAQTEESAQSAPPLWQSTGKHWPLTGQHHGAKATPGCGPFPHQTRNDRAWAAERGGGLVLGGGWRRLWSLFWALLPLHCSHKMRESVHHCSALCLPLEDSRLLPAPAPAHRTQHTAYRSNSSSTKQIESHHPAYSQQRRDRRLVYVC